MIGDWLQDHTNFPMQVRVVGEDYLYADFEDNEGDMWEFDDKIEPPVPIEISKELLEKNAFNWREIRYSEKHIMRYAYLTIKEHNTYIEWREDRKNIAIWLKQYYGHSDTYADIIIPVRYVHEMQQVLRLAGLTDIANNFKV